MILNDNRTFWKRIKPLFSNKNKIRASFSTSQAGCDSKGHEICSYVIR